MNTNKLNDILEEYALATPAGNDQAILTEMIRKYPEFAAELEDFAAARAVLRYAPEAELNAKEEAHFRELGLQNLRAVLRENDVIPEKTLQSLTDAAKAKGLNRTKFAAALGLSVSLVQYLEKRRLAFSSIPKTIVAKIAEVLETGEELIAAYLNQLPEMAAQSSYKTNTRAEEMPPKSFSEAVREDQTLTPDQKKKLLQL